MLDFLFMQGDANHNRVVNLQDLNILAARFGNALDASAPTGSTDGSLFGDARISEEREDLIA